MWRWVIAGTLLSGVVSAADLGEETSSQEALLQEVPGLDKAKEKLDEKKAAEDAKREERLAKLAELNKGKAARVVVLAWEGTDRAAGCQVLSGYRPVSGGASRARPLGASDRPAGHGAG